MKLGAGQPDLTRPQAMLAACWGSSTEDGCCWKWRGGDRALGAGIGRARGEGGEEESGKGGRASPSACIGVCDSSGDGRGGCAGAQEIEGAMGLLREGGDVERGNRA